MKLITTADGSHSVYSEKYNATYHSAHGALAESQHVFINKGLNFLLQNNKGEFVRIFELGFGTGLNAFLTFLEIQSLDIKVEYTAAEIFPLSSEIYPSLNYPELLGAEKYKTEFLKMHEAGWNSFCNISDKFALRKINQSVRELQHDTNYHLVYFDAFAFSAQPELWSEEIFKKVYDTMELNGILVTYSAKGQARRNMQAAGFRIEKIQGPPRKREMIRAMK